MKKTTKTDDFKKNLYDNYVSHHTAPRKGRPTKELWKRKASGWDHSFSKFLPSDRRVSIGDLGCGDGALVWWLQSRGYSDTCGVDISEEQISLSHELGVKNTQLGDVFEFLSKNVNSFDVLIMRDLLEHLTKQQIFEVLDLITKALKPSGQLIVQVPNGASPFFGATRYGDLTHEIAFTSTSLSQLFANFPFERIEYHSCPPIGLTIKSNLRVFLWKILHSFLHFYLTLENGPGKRILTQNIIAVAKL